jgi:hypothetical protein
MIDSGGHKVKSRSLTGPSARFGMTRLIFEWFLSQRWKRCATQRLYAALKRRSSTVVLAAVVVLLVRRRGQKQIRVKGDGRGCPSHTGWPRGLKPGFFFSDPNRHEWNSCPSRFLEGWVRCGAGESQQQVPPVSLRSRVGMTGVVVGVGLFAALESAAPPKKLYAAAVVEMPCSADGGVREVGILRLRMTSTSWASCFAQDDRVVQRWGGRSVRLTRAG